MKRITLLFFTIFFSLSVRAQELEPFINFLRSAPAFMNGDVSFNADSVLYQEGWSIVKIVKNKQIDFSFKENWLEVRPGEAFYVKYAGFRVKIESVRWTPGRGTETESTLPADFTGLSRKKVSAEVARTIENLFGEKLKRANNVLLSLRSEKSIGGLQKKAFSIVSIFSTGDNTVVIPTYRGEIGINLLPARDQAFNMYGMRVGIKEHDHYRSSIGFNGNTKGIYPHRLSFTSRQGVDINKGKEFKILARLVMTNVTLDASGMDLKMRLGASEITSAAMWALEMAARTQNPGASCKTCAQNAELPVFRMIVEKELRKAAMTQIKALVPQIQKMNVSSGVIGSFLVKETCRQNAIVCLQKASDDEREAKTCHQTLRQCLR